MNRQFCKYAAHIYVLCTVLGLLLFPVQGVSNFFLAIGANSIYIALGVALLSPLSAPWSIGCLIWSFVFFAALIVTYVMAIKKHYLPLLILSILDLVPVVLFGIYTFTEGNMYGLKLAILDIVVSIIVVSLFSVCFFIRKNQEQRKIADEAVS
jgi:hypothetical protein